MAKSRAQCIAEALERGHARGSPGFDDYVLNCQAGGYEGQQPPTQAPVGPCPGNGHLGQQVQRGPGKYVLIKPCEPGYKPAKASDGRIWCCKETVDEEGPGDNGEEEEGEIGEGCYKLSDNPIAAEGGKLWTDELITADMGFYRRGDAQGHWLHKDGKWYARSDIKKAIKNNTLNSLEGREGGACKKGYKRTVKDGVVSCCPVEGGEGGAGGEFKWSPELTAAIRQMLERYEEILDRPYGLTDEERQDIINYALKGVRGGERGLKQSKIDQLARMGMAGQPVELSEIGKIERGTRGAEADIRGQIGISEIDRKMQDFLSTTSTAGSILELLMGTEQLPEILSAGRRREGLDWASLLQNYLGMQMGQQNPYWQMLTNMMNQGDRGGDIMDWLPYLGYYVGEGIQRR